MKNIETAGLKLGINRPFTLFLEAETQGENEISFY